MRFPRRTVSLWTSTLACFSSSSSSGVDAWVPVARAGSARTLVVSALGSAASGDTLVSARLRRRIVGNDASRQALSTMSASAAGNEDTAKHTLRVALCQFHVTADKETNHQTAKDFVRQAADGGADLCVLPEVWNSPYATAAFPEYAETLPGIGDTEATGSASSQVLLDLAKQNGIWIVGGSIPEVVTVAEGENRIYNTCLVMDPSGKVVAKHRKVHLFDIDVPGGITFFESETLSPGESVSVFETPVGNIGVGICYDIRFAEYAMLLTQKHSCKIIIYPGAFNMTTGPAHWELLQRGRALDNQCYVVTASPARSKPPAQEGKYPHYTAWGHSTVVSPWGDVVATTDEKPGVVFADLDMSKVDEIRQSIPILNQRRSDIYSLEQVQKK